MAALLSVQYHLGPGGLAVLLEDDERFSLYLQRFLADHHVPYTLPLYDDSGKYLFAAPEKIEVLARGLLRAVGRGRVRNSSALRVRQRTLSLHSQGGGTA